MFPSPDWKELGSDCSPLLLQSGHKPTGFSHCFHIVFTFSQCFYRFVRGFSHSFHIVFTFSQCFHTFTMYSHFHIVFIFPPCFHIFFTFSHWYHIVFTFTRCFHILTLFSYFFTFLHCFQLGFQVPAQEKFKDDLTVVLGVHDRTIVVTPDTPASERYQLNDPVAQIPHHIHFSNAWITWQ